MQPFQSKISGLACALALALAASPALAGHKHGGHYAYGGYGMPHGKARHMHPRGGHPYCGKMMKRGHMHGPAQGPAHGKWGHPGRYPMGMKQGYGKPGYGYGGMKPQHEAATGKAYGAETGHSSPAAKSTPLAKDIVGTATAAGNFSTLLSAAKAAGLAETLSGEGPFTVLAPSDEAFSKLPQDQVAALMGDPEALKAVLTYHVIAGELSAAALLEQGEATTVNGAKVSVAQLDVAKADIKASNGVIHVLNAVLIPVQ